MQSLNQTEYQGNRIVEQYANETELYIITLGEGKFRLYCNSKKVCESKDYENVVDKIADYKRIGKENE